MKPYHLLIIFLLMPSIIGSFSGCSLYQARQDVRQLEQTVELLGEVIVDGNDKPVGIMLLREHLGKQTVRNYFVRYGSGPFRFFVVPGPVYLFAFMDQNENQEYDVGEPAAWYGGTVSKMIKVSKEGKVEGLFIELSDKIPEGTEAFVRSKKREDDTVKLFGQVRAAGEKL